MSFHIHISDSERTYLDNLTLSPQAKQSLSQQIELTIENVTDDFRLDPENRCGAGSPYFRVQIILFDLWGDERAHTVDFIIKDDKAEFGVLLLAFIEFDHGVEDAD